jgi:AcrR family transcriptional regulator
MTYESCFIKYTYFGRESQAFWRKSETKERTMTTHDQPEPQAEHDITAEKLASSTSSRNNGHHGNQPMPMTARGEATRRRILDAAEEVFGEFGYYEASISEITRRAGIAQGTFYIYFRSKHEVFAEVVEDMGKRLRAATREAIAGISDRLEAERQGFAAFFEFVAAHRRLYRIVQEAERIAPEAASSYYRGISQGYERALRAAMEVGTIRPMNAEALTYALMGIGHFVALRWLVWPEQGAESPESPAGLPDEVFASVMDFIAHGLAPSSSVRPDGS